MPARPMMMPPVGKSGPGTISISSSMRSVRIVDQRQQASITSPRLCGGMLVAMPTAMPPAPLTSRLGKRAGRTPARARSRRSWSWKSTVSLSMSSSSASRLGEPHFGVAHRRRRIAVDRAEIALPVDQRHAHRNPAPCAPARRRSPGRRADGICPSRRRRRAPICGTACSGVVAVLVHRIEDAPMHRLEPVARVGQRARHDHAHGVIEVAQNAFLDRASSGRGRGPDFQPAS
jgi:hypothetical protein